MAVIRTEDREQKQRTEDREQKTDSDFRYAALKQCAVERTDDRTDF